MVLLLQHLICLSISVATKNPACYAWSMEASERGRPKLPPEERKSSQLRIRLTAEERAKLDEAADGNTSAWARRILLKAAERRK